MRRQTYFLIVVLLLIFSVISFASDAKREGAVQKYLSEFCGQDIIQANPKIYQAIKDVLMRAPQEVFNKVTNRKNPVLFTLYYDAGTARFANSSDVIMTKDDAPAFQEGFTILKLSTALNEAQSKDAVAGIVAHELAHKFLEHSRRPKKSCALEREANRTIKSWGFEKEFLAAKKEFGSHEGDVKSCQE